MWRRLFAAAAPRRCLATASGDQIRTQAADLRRLLAANGEKSSFDGLGFVPSSLGLVKALDSCDNVDSASACFHWAAERLGSKPSPQVCSALVGVFLRAGRWKEAHKLFDEHLGDFSGSNAASFEAIVRGYAESGYLDQAWDLLRQMPAHIVPGVGTYASIIEALCRSKQPLEALAVFAEMRAKGVKPELLTYSTLVEALGKEGCVDQGCKLINEAHLKGFKLPIYIYSFYMEQLVRWQNIQDAAELFDGMIKSGTLPSVFICNCMIEGLCKTGRVDDGLAFFRRMESEYNCAPDAVSYTALITALKRCRRMDEVRELFAEMKEVGCPPDGAVYSTYVDGLCKMGKVDEGKLVLRDMLKSGCEPDAGTFNNLIDAHCKAGKVKEAEKLFKQMNELGLPATEAAYSALVDGFQRLDRLDGALGYFEQMARAGFEPDVILVSVLVAAMVKDESRLLDAVKLLGALVDGGMNMPAQNCCDLLVKRLCRAGHLDQALHAVSKMAERDCRPDEFSYAILIDALCTKNRPQDALEIVKQMKSSGYVVKASSYLLLAESLCRAKLVDEAYELYSEIKQQQGLDAGLHRLLLDLFEQEGRRAHEACSLFQEMIDSGHIPGAPEYTSLIQGLCKTGRVLDGYHYFKQMTDVGIAATSTSCSALLQSLRSDQQSAASPELAEAEQLLTACLNQSA